MRVPDVSVTHACSWRAGAVAGGQDAEARGGLNAGSFPRLECSIPKPPSGFSQGSMSDCISREGDISSWSADGRGPRLMDSVCRGYLIRVSFHLGKSIRSPAIHSMEISCSLTSSSIRSVAGQARLRRGRTFQPCCAALRRSDGRCNGPAQSLAAVKAAAASALLSACVMLTPPALADLNQAEADIGGEFGIGTSKQYGEAEINNKGFSQ